MKTIIKTVLMWAGLAVLIQVSAAQAQETIMYSANADAVFENYASTFRGDRRALSEDACRYLGNRPQPFPTDEALLLTAMEQLKPVIKSRIAETRKLI